MVKFQFSFQNSIISIDSRYDVMIQKDAKDILELYKEKLNKIPNGSIPGICLPYLPMYIISDNDQVSRLRRGMKVLQIPDFNPLSKEDKYSKTILYFPLRRGEDIDTERIDDYYWARNSNPVTDCNGIALTIIQEHERYIEYLI